MHLISFEEVDHAIRALILRHPDPDPVVGVSGGSPLSLHVHGIPAQIRPSVPPNDHGRILAILDEIKLLHFTTDFFDLIS